MNLCIRRFIFMDPHVLFEEIAQASKKYIIGPLLKVYLSKLLI